MPWTTPGTATAGEVLTASFWNTQVRDQFIELAPFMASWTSFTPTISGLSVGNGTHASAYVRVGKLIIIRYDFTFGSTTTISGAPVFSLPSGITLSGSLIATQVEFFDFGTARYSGLVEMENNTQVVCQAISTSGSYAVQAGPSATIPFTWTTNDRIIVGIIAMTT
jgi:hypothetical protein